MYCSLILITITVYVFIPIVGVLKIIKYPLLIIKQLSSSKYIYKSTCIS